MDLIGVVTKLIRSTQVLRHRTAVGLNHRLALGAGVLILVGQPVVQG